MHRINVSEKLVLLPVPKSKTIKDFRFSIEFFVVAFSLELPIFLSRDFVRKSERDIEPD